MSLLSGMFCVPELLVDGVSTADWRLLSRPTHLGPVSVEDAPCEPAALQPERPKVCPLNQPADGVTGGTSTPKATRREEDRTNERQRKRKK